MTSYETIQVEQSAEIVTVTLNRPKLNLFNEQMIEELIQVWHGLRKNKTARFVILTAEGDHFSAGVDLQAYGTGEFTAEDARRQQLAGHELMRSLESVEQVTVAVLR
ncbi:MAG: enoyl-CoA hydratase/isomerase family protein, partial [Deltaproteobacteria bacterium]|nr:enoyl-CoA hydratase/isomerase family protein [Deltaproteobacteria bacterium]